MHLALNRLLRITMRRVVFFTSISCFCFFGCSEFDSKEANDTDFEGGESTINRIQKLKDQEMVIDALKWENTRLSLKLKQVNGESLVKDKKTGLWHYDVERQPFTGRALEVFPDNSPRGEADFLKGKKDGMERFWWPNGELKEQGQWFDGRAHGVFKSWDQKGNLKKMSRYKNGELIEIILE